jgi:hypothetical protein
LTVERIKRLEEIGFEFDVYPKVVSWEDRFAQVVAYKEKHGNTFVPRNWKENPSLGEYLLCSYHATSTYRWDANTHACAIILKS